MKRLFNFSKNGEIHRAKTGVKRSGDNVYIHERMQKSDGKNTHEGYEVNFSKGTVKEFRR